MYLYVKNPNKNIFRRLVCAHFGTLEPVFRIRMDLGFFADPDPGFKSPDPDPPINQLMGSK